MPVHDGERWLDEAVESIRAQTFRNFELVVVLDGCRDRSQAILVRHAAADPRIRLIVQEPRAHLVRALNRGIAESRGAIIARMDADDIAIADRLEKQLEYLARHPDVAVVGGGVEYIDERGQALGTLALPTEPAALRAEMAQRNCVAHAAATFRRAAFDAAGGYRAALRSAEDYDLWLRIVERSDIANLADIVLKHRLHTGKISARDYEQQAISSFAARHFALLRRSGGSDPGSRVALVTPDILRETGASEAQIRALLRDAHRGQAYAALRVGDFASAVELMRRAQPYTEPADAPRQMAELRLAVADARRQRGGGWGERLGDLAQAFRLAPRLTLRHVRRGLRASRGP